MAVLQPSQRGPAGFHQRREVVLNDLPKPIFADVIVVVAEDVSERSDFVPRLSGQQHSSLVAELGYRLADAFKTTLDRIGNESIFPERRPVHTFGVPGDALAVLDNIEQTAGRLVRRQVFGPYRFLAEGPACGPAPPPHRR